MALAIGPNGRRAPAARIGQGLDGGRRALRRRVGDRAQPRPRLCRIHDRAGARRHT